MSTRTRLAFAAIASLGFAAGIGGLAGAAPALRAVVTTTTTMSTTTTTSTTPSTTTPSTTAPSPPQSVVVSPATVSPGGTTVVSGTCDPDTSGFAISSAFVHDATHDFAGVAAAPFDTNGTGHYSVVATIATTTAPGTYSVGVRCGGGLLAVHATLVVAPAAAVPVSAQPTFTG
jgi:hypothetical protein